MTALSPELSYLRKLVGLRPKDVPVIADPDDPAQRELTTAQAAVAAHVSEDTIRDWARASRGRKALIHSVAAEGEPPRYRELDVLRVEAATRRAARARRLAEEAAQGDSPNSARA